VLRDLAVENGIAIEYGKRLVGVVETPIGITACFADGSTAAGDVLIGADGIRSTVRTLIDPAAATPAYTGLLGFGGRVPVASSVADQSDAMHFVFGKRAFLGYWKDPDGGAVWFGNLPRDEPMTATQARAIPAADWLRLLRELYADDLPGRELLERTVPEQLIVAGAGEILTKVEHWSRGRMVLVGDAVHAPSSSSGQGASLAVESAIQLARCLRDIPDLTSAFAAYERLRRPRVEKVAANAARTNNNKKSGPVAKALMRLLMPIAMKTLFTPKKMFGAFHGYRIDWFERATA
jgi:2-polyprenyl-6-methoxyphenol hydroxylase-like FAD-dependent oxidoreductase